MKSNIGWTVFISIRCACTCINIPLLCPVLTQGSNSTVTMWRAADMYNMTDDVLQFEQYHVAWLCFFRLLVRCDRLKVHVVWYLYIFLFSRWIRYTIVHLYQYKSGCGSTEGGGGRHVALLTGTVHAVNTSIDGQQVCSVYMIVIIFTCSYSQVILVEGDWSTDEDEDIGSARVLITDIWHCNSSTQEHRRSNAYPTQAAGGVEQFIILETSLGQCSADNE